VCGVVSYSMTVAYFQRQYPTLAHSERVSDRGIGAIAFLLGPLGVIPTIASGWRQHKHGFML
jgi:hypothetical protein